MALLRHEKPRNDQLIDGNDDYEAATEGIFGAKEEQRIGVLGVDTGILGSWAYGRRHVTRKHDFHENKAF